MARLSALLRLPLVQLRGALVLLRGALARRGGSWARRRQGNDTLPVTLQARRIYILPTRAGLGFAALLFVMLLAGLNYGNSLALLLTFLLAGFMLVAMHQCHRTVLQLRVRGLTVPATFAGETATLDIHLENPGVQPKVALCGRARAVGAAQPSMAPCLDLTPGASAMLRAPLRTQRRGRLPVQRLELWSSAPFGLFRAWAWLHMPLEIVVYPRPAGTRLPPLQPGSMRGQRVAATGDDEWVDLKPFRHGDSPRQVAWKAYARGAPLLVREYRALGARSHWFDLSQVTAAGLEERLSQLALWIVAAEQRGERYGLRLPGQRIEPGGGNAHRHRCLTALALYDETERSA